MTIVVFAFVAVLLCIGGWVYGEVEDKRIIRITFGIATVIVFSGIVGCVSGIHTALSIGVPVSEAIHGYLDAASDQLVARRVDFVVKEFKGFKERAHVTYETGGFIQAVELETQRMRMGPPQ